MENKPEQAMRCYKKALALDPSAAVAGSSGSSGIPAGPRPSWVNNVLDDAATAGEPPATEAGEGGKPAARGSGVLHGEDSASAAAGQVSVAGQQLPRHKDIVV